MEIFLKFFRQGLLKFGKGSLWNCQGEARFNTGSVRFVKGSLKFVSTRNGSSRNKRFQKLDGEMVFKESSLR